MKLRNLNYSHYFKCILLAPLAWIAVTSLGSLSGVLTLIQNSPYVFAIGVLLHWIAVAVWWYVKQDIALENIANILNTLRYVMFFLGCVIFLLVILISDPQMFLFCILVFLLYTAAVVFPQIVFRVKENCYPFHKPWIVLAICGGSGTILLSVILHAIILIPQ